MTNYCTDPRCLGDCGLKTEKMMSEETITCKECVGGFIQEEDGSTKYECFVCGGDSVITFQSVKELAKELKQMSHKYWQAEWALEKVSRERDEALGRMAQ
jgi:hypothetical protein